MDQTVKGRDRAFYQPIFPNRWQGEGNCLIGPFSSRQLAERFARPAVDFGHYDSKVVRIFARNGLWYVELAEGERGRQPAA